MSRRLLGILAAILALVLACSDGPDVVDSIGGTGTETVGLMGVFVDSTRTPVAGARVVAVNAGTPVDTAYTDRHGAYLIDPLILHSAYDLHAILDDTALVAFVPGLVADSLVYDYTDGDSTLVNIDEGVDIPAADMRTDTMYAPGSISGRVQTADGVSPAGARIYIPGTSFDATAGADGAFVMTGVPPGTYAVMFALDNYLAVQLDGIIVRSNQNSVLPAVALEYNHALAPRPPTGLTGTYDTLSGTACLQWHPVIVSNLQGYWLYADTGNGVPVRLGPTLTDTHYCCTLFTDMHRPSFTARFQVRAVNTRHDPSLYSEPYSLVAASPALVHTTIAITADDSITLADTLLLAAAVHNPTRRNQGITWYVDRHDISGRVRDLTGLDHLDFVDTLHYHWQDSGEKWIFVDVIDDAGTLWSDSVRIAVTGLPIPQDTVFVMEPLTVARRSLAATVSGGLIYAIGGRYDRPVPPLFETVELTPLGTVEAYSLETPGWQPRAPLPQPRYAAAAVTIGDSIYVLGGSGENVDFTSIIGYDPAANQWFSTPAALPSVRYGLAACAYGGWIYVFGGATFDMTSFEPIVSDAIGRLDPRTGMWEEVGTMQSPRSFHKVTVCGDSVYIAGGFGGTSNYGGAKVLASTEIFVPSSPAATISGPSMQTPRQHFAMAAVDNRVYVLGGLSSEFMDTPLRSVESIGPAEQTWRQEHALPQAVHNCAAVGTQHSVWVIGGSAGTDPQHPGQLSAVLRYYP
ncbi:MAG: hypothetical protein GF331_00475 [Chitinivibrionales bacterium]|nr:hypothetical protein [Chitinivibrionales bacterium]